MSELAEKAALAVLVAIGKNQRINRDDIVAAIRGVFEADPAPRRVPDVADKCETIRETDTHWSKVVTYRVTRDAFERAFPREVAFESDVLCRKHQSDAAYESQRGIYETISLTSVAGPRRDAVSTWCDHRVFAHSRIEDALAKHDELVELARESEELHPTYPTMRGLALAEQDAELHRRHTVPPGMR